jgi:glycosyltransferase involved in cell wall biosynthesis
MKLDNLKFFPSVPREKMPELLSQFDLAVVPLKNIEIFDGARPSKIFELMGMQVPFIFCGKGEGAEIAEKSGGAIVVPPEAPGKLADAILEFASLPQDKRAEMGKRARKFVEENFDRAKIAEDFMKKITEI